MNTHARAKGGGEEGKIRSRMRVHGIRSGSRDYYRPWVHGAACSQIITSTAIIACTSGQCCERWQPAGASSTRWLSPRVQHRTLTGTVFQPCMPLLKTRSSKTHYQPASCTPRGTWSRAQSCVEQVQSHLEDSLLSDGRQSRSAVIHHTRWDRRWRCMRSATGCPVT